MKKIYCIINPNSVRNVAFVKEAINRFFEDRPETVVVWLSHYKGHTVSLAQQAVEAGASCVVACGGDGTINEVGRVLTGKNIPLGIIPLGSGNGIAGHFKIPKKIHQALAIIVSGNMVSMDVGVANGHFFFSNFGLGFANNYILEYQKNQGRGLKSYSTAFFKALKSFKYQTLHIEEGTVRKAITPFLLLISNSNQLGYGLSLSPKAKVTDQKLHLMYVEKTAWIRIFWILMKSVLQRSEPHNTTHFSRLKLSLPITPSSFQIDGELVFTDTENIVVSIYDEPLRVLTPLN